MSDVTPGDLVWANVGEGHDRDDDFIAIVAKGPHEVAGETKIEVQDPTDARQTHAVGFAGPDPDPEDRGLTYWLIK